MTMSDLDGLLVNHGLCHVTARVVARHFKMYVGT